MKNYNDKSIRDFLKFCKDNNLVVEIPFKGEVKIIQLPRIYFKKKDSRGNPISISAQHGYGKYAVDGESMELGFPTEPPPDKFIDQYAEDPDYPVDTIYIEVPYKDIDFLIDYYGGIDYDLTLQKAEEEMRQ